MKKKLAKLAIPKANPVAAILSESNRKHILKSNSTT